MPNIIGYLQSLYHGQNKDDKHSGRVSLSSLYFSHLEDNLDEVGFDSIEDGITNLGTNLRDAFLFNLEWIIRSHFNPCYLAVPWHTKYPSFMSFGFPKRSPYYPFVNYQILKLKESGKFAQIEKRHLPNFKDMSCNADPDVSLGYTKLISVFALLGAGLLAGLVLFVVEFLLSGLTRTRRNDGLLMSCDPNASIKTERWQKMKGLLVKYGIEQREDFLRDCEKIFN